MKCEHCENELKRMPFVLHVDQECSVNSGEDYLVDLCSFPCLRAWAIEHKAPPPLPEPKREPWDSQDYAKRQIVWLRYLPTLDYCQITDIYSELLAIASHGVNKTFAEVSENYTLPDGTELYKDSE